MVPTAYLYGLLGISAEHDGLHIAPKIPDAYNFMGVRKIVYANAAFEVCAFQDGSLEITPLDKRADFHLTYTPENSACSSYVVTIAGADGQTHSPLTVNADGSLSVRISTDDAKLIRITPEQ